MKYKNILDNDFIKNGEVLRFKNILLRAELIGAGCSSDCFFADKQECAQICCADINDNNICFKEISEIEALILKGEK